MKTQQISRFLGIDTRLPDFEMRVATKQLNGQYLRTAVNVEVDNAGRLRRRNGTAKIQTQTAPHSLYMTSASAGFLVRASTLYAVTLPTYTETPRMSLTSNAAMSYVTIGADTYYSNGTDAGRITAGVAYPLGLPTPSAPTTTVIGGALLKGWYQVSVAYYNNVTGEEGGISPSSNTEITATGALRVTLPGASTGATHVNIYVSGANGSIPLFVAQVTAATSSYDITAMGTGREAPQRFETVLPAGTLFESNGRLCSFTGKVVSVGLPFRPGYCDAVGSYLSFNDNVAIAIENQGGTYIATTAETFWFPGDLGDTQGTVSNPIPYGAVPGTEFSFPDKSLVGWFGTQGVMFGATSGEVVPAMEDHIDLTPPASGSSIVFQDKGYIRVATCGYCVNLESKATTQYSGWDFTSVSGNYGTKADGIYSLNATGPVSWSFSLGRTNFGAEELKHLPTAYIGVACDSQIEMTVDYADERGNDQTYTYLTRGSGAALKEQRFDVGRGIRSNWFGLSFSNSFGDDFTLASMSFAPHQSNRKI